MLFFAAFVHNYLTSLFRSSSFAKFLFFFFFSSAFLRACLSFSHFLSWSRRIHFYFVIRLLKSLPQSLSGEQGFNKNISWALRMFFLCSSLPGRWGENGNDCQGSGPGNERTYMSREIRYKLGEEGGEVAGAPHFPQQPTAPPPPRGQTGKVSVSWPCPPLLAALLPPRPGPLVCRRAVEE